MSGILIKNGFIIDGTKSAGRNGDLRIRDGRIAEIGSGLVATGEQVIDAAGAIVSPGFIDSHTHFDATVYWDPRCDPMALHGVTTVIAGNCSLGFAPVRTEDRFGLLDTFSYIEDMPSDLLNSAVPWDWENYDEYARSFDARPLGLNIATFVGHSQLRMFVMGAAAWERAATSEEIAKIADELEAALKAGALGMSFSLFDKDREGRPVPSRHADDAEIDALCAKLAEYKASLQFVTGANGEHSTKELRWLGGFLARHKLTGFLNALVHLDAEPGRSLEQIACIEEMRDQGANLWAFVSPRPFELRVDVDQTICFIDIPAWNELVQASPDAKRKLVHDSAWRERARNDADDSPSPMFPFYRPEQIRIIAAGKPELEGWIGKSLGDLAKAKGAHVSDALADWLSDNEFDTAFVNPVANSQPADVAKLVSHPVAMVSGSDAGAHMQMFCGAGDTTLLLTRYVRERGDIDLHSAVHALTGHQAQLLDLHDRGTLEVGKAADLVVFDLAELEYAGEKMVADVPGGRSRFTRAPGGFRYTIVNGTIVQEHGVPTADLPGRWVARQPG